MNELTEQDNVPMRLRDALLQGDDVLKTFDANYLDILDRKFSDLRMRYKINFLHRAQLAGADIRKEEIHLVVFNQKNKSTNQWEPVGVPVFNYQFIVAKAKDVGGVEHITCKSEVEEVFNPFNGEFEKMLVSTATAHMKDGFKHEGKAMWKYAVNEKNHIWKNDPYGMLEKTAIVKAARRAAPNVLSKMYLADEPIDELIEETQKIAEKEDDIESTAKTIEKETKILEDNVDTTPKAEFIQIINELCGEITKTMSMEQKAVWMKDNLSVTSFNQLKQFSKTSLKKAIENLRNNKTNRFDDSDTPWEK